MLEVEFSRFEGELDQALRRIVAARSISDTRDRDLVFEFISLVAAKNPRRREVFADFQADIMKKVIDLATRTPERWAAQMERAKRDGIFAPDADVSAGYREIRKLVETGKFTIETTTMGHLAVELPSVDTVRPLIAGRKWSLLRAPAGASFIASDHPVNLMWANPEERRTLPPPGFALARTQVLFPCRESWR